MERTEETTQVANPTEAVVTLDKPFTRGNNTIDSLTLRKPASGELRGVSLLDLMQMDVQALSKVLPRISQPTLTAHEVSTMDPADLLACGVAVSGFLLQKSAKEASLVA
ncbi:phage tail assembly protein [Pseudomonas denitrificans (nom. rej.)]|uniref:Phage tail assembly protein n=1 Tax=Pseudomonas denitrificans TaxID=43306 RepID=A0A9X7N5K3_PSEDE|nr:phage tail assembly protein [Pseudomonas denitrificans (nom. rej.)]QEY74105.1 phage tail assembly protein [Pseudomonas denitrificans (nom. rej.)]